jgi:hypothetical protein
MPPRVEVRVLSNDMYRTYHGRFPWVVERHVPFMLINGEVLIPDLSLSISALGHLQERM